MFYFGRQTIFKKICARYLSERNELAASLYQSGYYENSLNVYNDVYNYSGSFNALFGIISSEIKLKQYKTAFKTLNNEITKSVSTSYFYNLELLLGDLCSLTNQYSSADSIYSRIVILNPSVNISNICKTRKLFLKDSAKIQEYLAGSDFDKYKLLLKLNSDSLIYTSIPSLIYLSEKLDENYNSFIKLFKERFKVTDFAASYAAFRLSEYCEKKGDLRYAEIFAVESLNNNRSIEFNSSKYENLRRIKWFINNREKISGDFIWKHSENN